MHWLDLSIFGAYMVIMLGIGFYFLRKNEGGDDYYVGGRQMGSLHVGFSVVATDVGGGFSIGLGGLGFAMGLSGSWMLFTGLVGAWITAVFLIPKVKRIKAFDSALTFPQVFGYFYDRKVALLAGIISAVGYVGFTGAQILAGAKLAHGTFVKLDLQTALVIMGTVAIIYTVMGGLKAVIYTDSLQWAILIFGLTFIALPVGYFAVGGWPVISSVVRPEMLTLTNLSWQDFVNWCVTIIPIWFVGMTLYQRIYSCRDEKTARRAWYVAGILEWPVMAMMGVSLGLLARVAADQGLFAELGVTDIAAIDSETGLPMLLRTVLPVGLMGIVMSAYFSAILSTADSCLMACSGNLVSDIIGHFKKLDPDSRVFLRLSQITTLILGLLALVIASSMTSVLDLMLYSYAFMVSGLFVPVIAAFFSKRRNPTAAFWAMIIGGTTTVSLELMFDRLPLGLDANVFGISASAIVYIVLAIRTKPE